MSARKNPGTYDPALVYDGGIEELKVICSCCSSVRLVGVIMRLLHFGRLHLCFPDSPLC